MSPDSAYDVYLVDPGVRASHVLTLVQEVTKRSTPECAELVHDTPAHIASFSSRQAAEDLTARFREFDAVAIVRRSGEPGAPEPPPPSVVPQPKLLVAVGLMALGIVQLVVAIWWLAQTPAPGSRTELAAAGGLVLGVVALAAGIWKLRSRELD